MNTRLIALAALLALTGCATLTADPVPMPAAGENPVFGPETAQPSARSRAAGHAEAVHASGNAATAQTPALTRAEVRAQLREAMSQGFHVASGEEI